ncbi:hypothetical protein F4801DRAFT_605023 [Xylaria longipes]|nr:hypothetical protein F4801DRAFT_605023 [Xylaria longipes]
MANSETHYIKYRLSTPKSAMREKNKANQKPRASKAQVKNAVALAVVVVTSAGLSFGGSRTVRDGLGVDQIMSQVKLVNARGELVEVETEFEAVVKIFGVSKGKKNSKRSKTGFNKIAALGTCMINNPSLMPSNESVLGSRVDHLMLKLVAVAGVQDLEVKGAEWSRDFMQRF